MPRMQFYKGVWEDPPPTEEIYEVPINPYSLDPVDEVYVYWQGGLNLGNRYERHYDSREKELEWKNLPAYSVYNTMIHIFEDYQYADELYINLGNSIAPGLYSTGDEWHQIRVTSVKTKIADGSKTTISGGQVYNVYSAITLYFEDLGVR